MFGGNSSTDNSNLAIALGMTACRLGHSVGFYTAADLVNTLLEAQSKYQLSRLVHSCCTSGLTEVVDRSVNPLTVN